jgi:hypothetical protein
MIEVLELQHWVLIGGLAVVALCIVISTAKLLYEALNEHEIYYATTKRTPLHKIKNEGKK